ncbi:calcium/sodium antiporter [Sulfurospirillum sp. T05]|uniref:Calcium/sodium antiporter n=1 Tax=Sulfurospirillum tamanense TaxID=2813362 RepID=A0ABS2WSW1_9BACT|nr:calcium/sodium antiporter [Sulfurospirillum tamanensis]MBN2964735.1 calcium/sodium antiporter [Sulfurospirillum tamanensis]
MEYLVFLASMSALIYGANRIIEQSEHIALRFGISHFVIGATLIALGTSLPEMATSISASIQGKGEMAVGNVIGSTTFNITLVLGLIFLIAKTITPKRDMFAHDSAWALFPFVLFLLMAYDGAIGFLDGVLFLMMMGAYLLFLNKQETGLAHEEPNCENFSLKQSAFWLLLGFGFVIVGAHFTIDSAALIARNFGVDEWLIALLLIAFGTSLPELIVSIVAAKKGNGDMIVGNIVGSNVANFTVVLGASALFSPLPVNFATHGFDIACAGAASVMLVFLTANRLYNASAGIGLLAIFALMLISGLGQFLA